LASCCAKALLLCACATGPAHDSTGHDTRVHDVEAAIAIPPSPSRDIAPRQLVADHLNNPRGMLVAARGTLLVAQAGRGLEDDPFTGSLTRLADTDGDGYFETPEDLLSAQASTNLLELVRRDEVFGLAAIATGGGDTLVSAAFFDGPSQIYRLQGHEVGDWATVPGNVNAMSFDTRRGQWLGVSSSTEQILRLAPGRPGEEILRIPDLPQGQDPVPGYLLFEPATGDVLVTLFSGSPLGEEGGDGTEIVKGSGGVIRVNPDTGDFHWVVAGLTAPTDLALDGQGRLYVLEFCDDFLDPLTSREDMAHGVSHGGFRRYSGRLLRIDLDGGEVTVIAERLDGPTNLALDGNTLFIAQGMGTPGRMIPGPQGPVPLRGFIERLTLD